VMCISSLPRDIKLHYPELSINVKTSCPEIFENNPHLTEMPDNEPGLFHIGMRYDMISESSKVDPAIHMFNAVYHDWFLHTGLLVRPTRFGGDLYFTEEEQQSPLFPDVDGPWVLGNFGGKRDFLSKYIPMEMWATIVRKCPNIQFVQIGISPEKGESYHEHVHLDFPNVVNKIDQTNKRQFLVAHLQSLGAVSTENASHHICAALNYKPNIVLSKGHMSWWWLRFPGAIWHHTIGCGLHCCRWSGCFQAQCQNYDPQTFRHKCLDFMDIDAIVSSINDTFGPAFKEKRKPVKSCRLPTTESVLGGNGKPELQIVPLENGG